MTKGAPVTDPMPPHDDYAQAEARRVPPEAIERGVAALIEGLRSKRPGHEFIRERVVPSEGDTRTDRAPPAANGDSIGHRAQGSD